MPPNASPKFELKNYMQLLIALCALLIQSGAIIYYAGKMQANLDNVIIQQKIDKEEHANFVQKDYYNKDFSRIENTLIRLDAKIDKLLENQANLHK